MLTVARMLNLSIPYDLSVTGVDNYVNVCEKTSPTLTSVEPDFRRAGASAAEVVRMFPYSRVYAEMRFRKATGQSILEAIQTVRIERAKELLRNPSQQLKAIADFCSFKSQNALCKFFRKKTGRTMSVWRTAPHP